jgi:hypothetical protein
LRNFFVLINDRENEKKGKKGKGKMDKYKNTKINNGSKEKETNFMTNMNSLENILTHFIGTTYKIYEKDV